MAGEDTRIQYVRSHPFISSLSLVYAIQLQTSSHLVVLCARVRIYTHAHRKDLLSLYLKRLLVEEYPIIGIIFVVVV